MAEEQFTSRRARREAERRAAEQAFEARESPEQPNDATPSRADLLSPRAEKQPDTPAVQQLQAPAEAGLPTPAETDQPVPEDTDDQPVPEDTDDQSVPEVIEDQPVPEDADDQPAGEREDLPSRIDPNPVAGTPHERGALASDHPLESRPPVNAEDRLDPTRAPLPHFETRAEKKRYLREHGLSLGGDLSTGATPVVASDEELAEREAAEAGNLTDTDTAEELQHESYDTAGFGGDSDEVAARDFEAPVTPESAPRPTSIDDEPYDALSKPFVDVEADETDDDSEPASESAPESAPSRSRRMPIVRPPSAPGVRVVTAASAQLPEADEAPSDRGDQDPAQRDQAEQAGMGPVDSDSAVVDEAVDSGDAVGSETDTSVGPDRSDEAARALAADPETRPMDTVPEAWALPNADYEDEETENPPGDRIRASTVTGQDGRILMGEEPSKMPYIVLGIAGFFALALIIIALVMFL